MPYSDAMRDAVRSLARLLRDRKAATAIEYGLIVGLIAMVAIVAIFGLGSANSAGWGAIHNKYAAVNGG